ncbi:MAG: YggU family protein [Candidatus Thermoplasmatota archaeon]|nr:YggU family protein [Candidatus Thermoplasmatota archaeon]
MLDKALVRDAKGGSVIAVEVSPNASETEITGVNKWRGMVQVRVAAPARDGAANEELVRYLSERLGVPRSGMRILRGHTSTMKAVFVPLRAEEALRRLGVR